MSDSRPTSNVRRVDFGKAGDKAVAASGMRVSSRRSRRVDQPSDIESRDAEPGEVGASMPISAPAPSTNGVRGSDTPPSRSIVQLRAGERPPRSRADSRQNGVLILAVMLAAILGATLAAILLNPGL